MIYRSPENGFTVASLIDAQGAAHSFCGTFPDIAPGQPVKLRGVWENTNYGLRLKVVEFEYVLPTTREGIERFLGSGMIPGVGPKLAKNIVDYFGDRTLEILDTKPGRLREIEKIGAKKADKIIAGWRGAADNRRQFIFFQGLGLTPQFSRKLLDFYGGNAAQTVRANPYKLADDIDGVGFLKADRIAERLGVAKDSPARLLAGIVFCVNNLTQIGHTCYPKDKLIEEAAALLAAPPEKLEAPLQLAIASRQLVEDNAMIYPAKLYRAERELPKHLHRLMMAGKFASEKMADITPAAGLTLNRQQFEAVDAAAKSPVSIITGGPGVGKTTVLGELVRRARAAKLNVALTAPTGRAAKRLSEAAGVAAKTIHRLLVFDPATGGFMHDAFNPLDCELIIIDEASMLDLPLALALFQALKSGCTAVLVGDADQLPSVGPGTVLASLIASEKFPVTRLTEVFRQSAASLIVANAHRVNAGRLPTPPPHGAASDFYWIKQSDPEKVVELIGKLMLERIPAKFGLSPKRDIQILAPMNRGNCGANRLNQMMQKLLNGNPHTPGFRRGEGMFKSGDKVMQLRNDYDKAVFNGDLGEIAAIDFKEHSFTVNFDGGERPVEYDFEEADQLALAYAVTVHKSQGSEFPAVILPLLSQHYMMLQRNLLYTAMTRAKKLLILIGGDDSVAMAVKNVRQSPRFGNLTAALQEKNP